MQIEKNTLLFFVALEIQLAIIMGTSFSEPSPRYNHFSTSVGSELFIIGDSMASELDMDVHSFNQSAKSWEIRAMRGKSPPGLHHGGCITSGHNIYLYGGTDGSRCQDSLYQLDTDSLTWSQLPSGPVKKAGCRMVTYEDKLFLFGGYGYSSSQQPGMVESFKNSWYHGWTDELHQFDLQEGEGV